MTESKPTGLRLNLRTPSDASQRTKQAAQKKAEANAVEPMEDAWQRIFASKLTDADRAKLIEVKNGMESGLIGRNPSSTVNKAGKPKRFSKAEALRLYKELVVIQRDSILAEMVDNTPDNYRLIQTEEQLAELIADLKNEEIIAVDTETTGVDVYADVIVGMSFSLPNAGYHVYIPVAHEEGDQLGREYVLAQLRPFIEDEALGKVLHNAKFDKHMFKRHDVELRGIVHDTQVAMHVLNENEMSYRLKDLATKYLKEPSDTYSTLFGKAGFETIPLDVACVYAAKDTDITWRLYQFQRTHMTKIPQLERIYNEVENPVIEVSYAMERSGFVLDLDFAEQLRKELTEEIADLQSELISKLGDLNFNSPVQLSKVLFDELKLDRHIPKNFKKSTDVRTLKLLRKHHEGVDLLLKYREKTKLLGTYVESLPKQVKDDGRVHGNFRQDATVTGRFASNNPNLQNQPYYVRKLFIPPEGKVLLSGDFSQQEPRLLAHFTDEEVLINAYREGKDLYSTAASELFGLPIEECGDGSKYRKMMKTGILAVMYGTGHKTLAGQLDISEQEAEEFIENFYVKYPKVKAWIDGNVSFARKHGYVEMLGGRKRRLPQIKSRDRWERLRAERQCTNAIIQGSAAIMTKIAMINVYELCKRKGWDIAWSCHDEIGIYTNEDVAIEDVRDFEKTMLDAVKLKVPNKSDIEISRRWGQGQTIEEWYGV